MAEREFVCMSCGNSFENFLADCPACGGTQYRSRSVEADGDEEDPLTGVFARLSRPVNPITPA